MVTGVLFLITMSMAVIIGSHGSWIDAILFFLGFMIAAGPGAVIRRFLRGTLTRSPTMFLISGGILLVSFWLGGHGSIILFLGSSPTTIAGEWWAVLVGTLAGAILAEPEEAQKESSETSAELQLSSSSKNAAREYQYNSVSDLNKSMQPKPVSTKYDSPSDRFMALCPNCRTNAEHLSLPKKHLVRCLLCSHERPTTS